MQPSSSLSSSSVIAELGNKTKRIAETAVMTRYATICLCLKIQPVINLAVTRLHEIRCLLNSRGIAAAPELLRGRTAPLEFSSCYSQRRMETDIE